MLRGLQWAVRFCVPRILVSPFCANDRLTSDTDTKRSHYPPESNITRRARTLIKAGETLYHLLSTIYGQPSAEASLYLQLIISHLDVYSDSNGAFYLSSNDSWG